MTDSNNENNFDEMGDMSFAELFESYESKTGPELNQGDRVDGKIISIGSKSIYVDTGTKSDGVVDKTELLDEDGQLSLKVGDPVTLYVVSTSESEIILSKAISGAGKAMMLQDALQSRTPIEGKVAGVIKGGVHVDLMGKRAFCPASQLDVKYVENQEEYIGKSFHFLITRFEEGGKNIVVSRRELLNEEIKERAKVFFKDHKTGDIVHGIVTRLMSFGAFVELTPGLEGMVHISELSWSRVENASDVVAPGDRVSVKILKIESGEKEDTYKISLSVKQTIDSPWESMDTLFHVGDQVSGKVVRLTKFGAFVELAPGVDGLVHISEMSHTRRVLKADDVVAMGDQVQVVVKSIEMDSQRISLSIKDALDDPWMGATAKYEINSKVQGILEKKETFGLFIRLEPGITGLMPSSNLNGAANRSDYDKLKPGDTVEVMIQAIDEEQRRITLTSPDQKESDDWKQFSGDKKASETSTMESLFLEAMKKKK
ncbi:MAG: 30S ribosomal protein S1 [Pseudomonadota bacterium]